ncbi:MAG: hypothetical protein LIP77_00950, partial [Planctomycetes bacterium]|nr:hypothetical protein [Planctomycetota bacterium]
MVTSTLERPAEDGHAIPLDRNLPETEPTTLGILVTISLCHFLNDTTQARLVPTYPLLKEPFSLN